MFTDCSADPSTKVGYGAALVLEEGDSRSLERIAEDIKLKRFEETSSSRLELETLLWALGNLPRGAGRVVLFTDSQTIANLPARREKLEAVRFCSKSGVLLSQADLYREFYDVWDRNEMEVVKLSGHMPSIEKSRDDLVFSLLDRAARSALRRNLSKSQAGGDGG
ncbi:RNase H family protein [Pelagicoccus mobilis]|uniref:RNase H family protein n=1 Tax=Pelagicoccus mobilis TaxID=415221 RepID=UPI00190426F6|nr:RNase H family protein [Pelagicoccus mobilis]